MPLFVCYRRVSRATVYFHVPWSPCSWCMYARPSSSVPCVAFHFVPHFYSAQARHIRLVGSSTHSRAPLPRKWPVTPLAGRLPPLVTRCSPSAYLLTTSASVFLSVCRWDAVLIKEKRGNWVQNTNGEEVQASEQEITCLNTRLRS